jgi:hypothetical protein
MPTCQMVVADGVPVWEISGFGVMARHQQLAQAQLLWHCQAVARGYQGPAPVISPAPIRSA